MNTDLLISSYERQEHLHDLITKQQRISIAQICQHFSISEATARRDLDALAEKGKIRRVHGGAIAIQQAPPELPVLQRAAEQAEHKRQIGKLAATLVEDGDTIFLGSGSTVLEVARCLQDRQQQDRQQLTVVTNSLLVVNALSAAPGITLVGLGGIFRKSELSFIGHITEQAVAELHADKIILGIHALDPVGGLTSDYLQETMTDRAILRSGKQVIIVADHSKCGRVSTAFVAPITVVNTLVTDRDIPPKQVEELIAKGIHVLTT
jgi:DeoR family transcriptional regulator, aga operon transcriptional repressor